MRITTISDRFSEPQTGDLFAAEAKYVTQKGRLESSPISADSGLETIWLFSTSILTQQAPLLPTPSIGRPLCQSIATPSGLLEEKQSINLFWKPHISMELHLEGQSKKQPEDPSREKRDISEDLMNRASKT